MVKWDHFVEDFYDINNNMQTVRSYRIHSASLRVVFNAVLFFACLRKVEILIFQEQHLIFPKRHFTFV